MVPFCCAYGPFGYRHSTICLRVWYHVWLRVLYHSIVGLSCNLVMGTVPFGCIYYDTILFLGTICVCVGMYHSAVGMIPISFVYSFICCIYNRPTIRLSCGCGCDTVSLRVLYSQVVGVPGTLSLHIMVPSDIFFRSLHMTTLSGADLAL